MQKWGFGWLYNLIWGKRRLKSDDISTRSDVKLTLLQKTKVRSGERPFRPFVWPAKSGRERCVVRGGTRLDCSAELLQWQGIPAGGLMMPRNVICSSMYSGPTAQWANCQNQEGKGNFDLIFPISVWPQTAADFQANLFLSTDRLKKWN